MIPSGRVFLEAGDELVVGMAVSETGDWFRTVAFSAAVAAGPLIRDEPRFLALWGDGDAQRAKHLLEVLVLSVSIDTLQDELLRSL